MTPSAPLTIVVKKADRILKATVAAATRPEIAFRADIDQPRSVVLSFHHLDHKDGATIEILHTASNPFDVDLTGDVIGTGGRLRKVAPPPLSDDLASFRIGYSAPPARSCSPSARSYTRTGALQRRRRASAW